jgi:hypothetical protein
MISLGCITIAKAKTDYKFDMFHVLLFFKSGHGRDTEIRVVNTLKTKRHYVGVYLSPPTKYAMHSIYYKKYGILLDSEKKNLIHGGNFVVFNFMLRNN